LVDVEQVKHAFRLQAGCCRSHLCLHSRPRPKLKWGFDQWGI
jgi:hypothetical protein